MYLLYISMLPVIRKLTFKTKVFKVQMYVRMILIVSISMLSTQFASLNNLKVCTHCSMINQHQLSVSLLIH